MSARIIHVGADACHRLVVLERAGFRVQECSNIAALREVLESEPGPDAVVVTEDNGPFSQQAVAMVQTYSSFPLILFGEPQHSFAESGFDLVVPILSPPDVWLAQVAAVIAHGQTVRIRSILSGTDASLSHAEARHAVSQSVRSKRSSNPGQLPPNRE